MPKPESYARRLVKGSAVVFTALVASAFVGFLLRMFLARSLEVTDYGMFYAVFALVSFFALFQDLGLTSAIVKYIPEFEVKRRFDEIKSSVVCVALVQGVFAFSVVAVLFILSSWIAPAVFGTGAAVLPFRILCIWFFAAAFYVLINRTFQGFQSMPTYASMEFLNILLIFLLALLFVGGLHQGIKGITSAYLVGASVMAVLGLVLLRKERPQVFWAKASITRPLLKKLFAFALPVFLGGLGGLIISYTDTLTITVFRTLPEVGFYQAAQPTAHVLWYFAGSLVTVLFPMVSELWTRHQKKLLRRTLHFLTKFSFILIIPPALAFIAFPEIVIRLLFGSEYLAGAVALQILSAAAIVYTLYIILSNTMAGIGKPAVVSKTVALMACLNLAGNLLLVRAYGIEGIAAATLCSYLLGLVLLFYYVRKFVGFTVPLSPLLKTLVGAVLTLGLMFGLKSVLVLSPWPEAFAVVVPSLVFYGVWILATKAVTRYDLELMKQIVPLPKWLIKMARP